MAEIEHSLIDIEESDVSLNEVYAMGQYIQFDGDGSQIIIYLDNRHFQKLSNELASWGYLPEEQ